MLALFLAASLQLDRVQQSLVATYRHYSQAGGGERLERDVNGKTEVVYDTTHDVATGFSPSLPERHEPIIWYASARVFEANPVVKLNDPALQDQNNSASAVPPAAYSIVDLPDLAAGAPLSGPNAKIVDVQAPFTPQADPSQPLMFDRSQPQFEEVNAYFHIDRAQRYLQSLGYTGMRRLVNYPIPIDPHAVEGADNSFYIQGDTPGQGSLFFGDGGTDDAEDSDLMIHEFGHAIEDWIAPGAFGGGNASESRALGEGFGDYWAFSAKYEDATASGRDPFCIADWDARCGNDDPSQNCSYPPGADCLRRVDSTKTMADFQRSGGSGTEHLNGAIWSSTLRQIFLAIGKRAADTIVIESHFGTPPNPTFAAMADLMLDADRLLYGGAHAAAICSAMTQRGILASCERLPKGELTYFQSPQQGIAIPDNDPAGIESQLTVSDFRDAQEVFVHVDIAHPSRGDLTVSLVAPDGTEILLHGASTDRTPDIHGTYGIDLLSDQPLDVLNGRPVSGVWKLRVADVQPHDTGALLSWSLVIQFVGDAASDVRPAPAGGSLFIAAVAHAPGANGTLWRSDVHLTNRGDSTANLTIVFTPSGQDGSTQFGAVKLAVEPGHVVAFDDIVAEQFKTVGTGQLEIAGDVANIVANARTYTQAPSGTYGQFTAAVDGGRAGVIGLLRSNDAFRTNIGFAETAGGAGTIRVRLFDMTGTQLAENRYAIAPFSHRQDLVTSGADAFTAKVDVVEGNARVLAYGTVVDNRTGDPIYVPAAEPLAVAVVAPVISAAGAYGTQWTSEAWSPFGAPWTYIDTPTGDVQRTPVFNEVPIDALHISYDVVGAFQHAGSTGLLLVGPLGTYTFAFARTWTPGDGGTFGQFVPFVPVDSTADMLMPIENSATFRTNIGLANLGATDAMFRVTIRDASGATVARRDLLLSPQRLVQFLVVTPASLRNGSAIAQRVDSAGPFLFYASVVDNGSGDAVHIPAE